MSVLCLVLRPIDLPQHLLIHDRVKQKNLGRPLTGLSTRQSTKDNPSSNWILSGKDPGTNTTTSTSTGCQFASGIGAWGSGPHPPSPLRSRRRAGGGGEGTGKIWRPFHTTHKERRPNNNKSNRISWKEFTSAR